MNTLITQDYAAMSRAAADIVCTLTAAKPAAVIVFPTGGTPVGLFHELIVRRCNEAFDPSRLRIFQMDDYYPVDPADPRSLYHWLKHELLIPLGITPDQVVELPSNTADPQTACHQYDQALAAAGGFDLALLGLGPNGHIAFNDPPAHPAAPSRVLDLTESSIATAIKTWGSRQATPKQAITVGMAQILAAKQIVLMVSGAGKREILHQALHGPLTPDVPASYLRQAANVTVIADRAAWPES
jgi:glucosamine-6-phosphate deaminase